MTMINEMLMNPWVLVGLAILVTLCIFDFHQRVRRATSRVRFVIALILFLGINAVVYVALVAVFITNPMLLLIGAEDTSANAIAPLIPILTAFLYFGTGSSRWQLFGIEIDVYEKLVAIANKALCFSIDRAEVRKEIFAHEAEYERLRASLENLHAAIEEKEHKSPECKRLVEEWKAIEQDCGLIESHIGDLKKIRETIESNHKQKALELLRDGTEKREAVLRQDLIDRLKTHLYSFIVLRAKTKDDVKMMLESIPKAKGPWTDPPIPLFDKPLPHAILVGVFFGMFVGLIAARFPTGSLYTTPWIGAAACGVFAAIFFLIMKSREMALSGTIGAAAGLAGFVVWASLNEYVAETEHEPFTAILMKSIVGVLYGGISGLIIHHFRFVIHPRTTKAWSRTLIVAAMGAVAFFSIRTVLAWLFPDLPQIEDTTRGLLGMVLMAMIGAVFLVGLANACKLLGWGDRRDQIGAASG
jgi:hypothetical protein